MVKRSGNYKAKSKMIKSYTHLDVRNAFVKCAAKQLTTLPRPVIKCACIWNLKQGSLQQKTLSSGLAVLTISTLKCCQFLLMESRH